jgi:hypothetical protein
MKMRARMRNRETGRVDLILEVGVPELVNCVRYQDVHLVSSHLDTVLRRGTNSKVSHEEQSFLRIYFSNDTLILLTR